MLNARNDTSSFTLSPHTLSQPAQSILEHLVSPVSTAFSHANPGSALLRGLCEGAYLVLDSALKGVGDTRFTMVAEIAAELLVWTPAVALVLGFTPSVVALYLTMPLWLAVGAAVLAVRWRGGRWRDRAVV